MKLSSSRRRLRPSVWFIFLLLSTALSLLLTSCQAPKGPFQFGLPDITISPPAGSDKPPFGNPTKPPKEPNKPPFGNPTKPPGGGPEQKVMIIKKPSPDPTSLGFAFSPTILTVKKGTKVTWVNTTEVGHTVEVDKTSPTKFTTPELSQVFIKGQTRSAVLNTTGTYAYHCGPHPNMKATITVTG